MNSAFKTEAGHSNVNDISKIIEWLNSSLCYSTIKEFDKNNNLKSNY